MTSHEQRFEEGLAAVLFILFIGVIIWLLYMLFKIAGSIIMMIIGGGIGVIIFIYLVGYAVTDMTDDIKSMRGDK